MYSFWGTMERLERVWRYYDVIEPTAKLHHRHVKFALVAPWNVKTNEVIVTSSYICLTFLKAYFIEEYLK